jgi:hypothetical protein
MATPIAECRLDWRGLREQRERYRAMGRHVNRVQRGTQRLVVHLSATVEPELVRETITVERDCCPFFGLAYDEGGRRLTVTVADPGHDAALDAIAFALGQPRLEAGAGI